MITITIIIIIIIIIAQINFHRHVHHIITYTSQSMMKVVHVCLMCSLAYLEDKSRQDIMLDYRHIRLPSALSAKRQKGVGQTVHVVWDVCAMFCHFNKFSKLRSWSSMGDSL